jgi:RNA polymerase sigma-70 factor (ECF subfamily)
VSDQQELDRLREGIEEGFDAIFRTYYADLVGFAEAILRDRTAGEDVAQDVMLELWGRRNNIVLDTSLRAYLLQVARNRALNLIRHHRVVVRLDPRDVVAPPHAHADRTVLEQEIDVVVRRAVTALPTRCREVFQLSRVHGLKYAEIAETLGISVKTVEAQMGKALRTIRQQLHPWLPEGGGL